jgi:hypothetical protein
MATNASPFFDPSFDRPVVSPRSAPDDPPTATQARPVPPISPSAAFPTWAPSWGPHPQAALPPTPPPPTRPTSQQPTPPEPARQPPSRRQGALESPRRPKELAWLTWQLPAALRQSTTRSLRETLRWRARECEPLLPPAAPVARVRFGLRGEQLAPCAVAFVCDLLITELRESVRTLEASLSWSERNWRLAMHSIRLSQLCAALEQRGGIDVLEVICAALEPLWN